MTSISGKSYLIKTNEKASTPGSGSSEAASIESLKVEHTQMDGRVKLQLRSGFLSRSGGDSLWTVGMQSDNWKCIPIKTSGWWNCCSRYMCSE